MDLLTQLENFGFQPRRTGKQGEYILICPRCQKPKLAINVDKRLFQCWKCGDRGGIHTLSKFLGVKFESNVVPNLVELKRKYVDIKKLDLAPITDKDSVLPHEFLHLTNAHSHGILAKKALDYVLGRGVTREMIEKWNLGFCLSGDYKGYIIIPVYDIDNNVRTFQGRKFYGNGPKNRNPLNVEKIVFNLRHAQGYPGLVVVEGPWDSMATHMRLAEEFNITSTALMGHSCNQMQARQIAQYLKPEYIWICLDPDVTEAEREAVAATLMAEGLQNVKICHPDTDPDEIMADKYVNILQDGISTVRRKIINV